MADGGQVESVRRPARGGHEVTGSRLSSDDWMLHRRSDNMDKTELNCFPLSLGYEYRTPRVFSADCLRLPRRDLAARQLTLDAGDYMRGGVKREAFRSLLIVFCGHSSSISHRFLNILNIFCDLTNIFACSHKIRRLRSRLEGYTRPYQHRKKNNERTMEACLWPPDPVKSF